jgi:putative transposase
VPRCPIQRCAVHKHRNLLARAPERLHQEITPGYNDMIYAVTLEHIERRRKAFIPKWRLKHRAVADSLERFGSSPSRGCREAREERAHRHVSERLHEEFKRRIKTQTVLPSAGTAAIPFWALLASGQISTQKSMGGKR